jgi:hypothetical protein
VNAPAITANIATPHTGEFEAPLSHLTSTTAFIETMHGATFGDVAELRVFDVRMKAEVIFVSDAPMGWVLRFEPNPVLEERMKGGAQPASMVADLDIEAPVPYDEDANAVWGDTTNDFEGPPSTALGGSAPHAREGRRQ